MGNLCSSCLRGSSVGDDGSSSQAAPVVELEPVEAAIVAARQELDRAQGRASEFSKEYCIDRLVGHGAFAKVHSCTRLATGEQFAVKIVPKELGDCSKQREQLVKELAIARTLQAHPNSIRVYDVFEGDDAYYLVMELCTGGELFDQVIKRGHFSERDAARLMQQLLDFCAYAHAHDVIHRDLKPENILLTDGSPGATLKVVDFGTSDFCKEGQWLSQKFGTPYYVAPEVLQKHYNKAADIWSAGVVLYILLSGAPPFGGKSDSRILQKVQQGSYSFARAEWDEVSETAKQVITAMLVVEPEERASAQQLLQHPWFTCPAPAAPDAQLGEHMLRHLRAFAGMSHMKRLALVALARTLTDRDVTRLRHLFIGMDADGDGRVAAAELHAGLASVGAAIEEGQMQALVALLPDDGSGQIEYEAFIAAMIDCNKVAKRRGALRQSFEHLDRDGDGYITVSDLAQVLQEGANPAMKGPAGRKRSLDMAALMVHEVDRDNDSRVSYAEFRAMWQCQEQPA